MRNLATENKSQRAEELVVRLPEKAMTRGGVVFNPNDEVWAWFDGPFRLHLDFAKVNLTAAVPVESLKYALMVIAKRSSPSHVKNLFVIFQHFLTRRKSPSQLTSITVEEVSNYAAQLEHRQRGNLGKLNALIQTWRALCLPGVSEDCADYLREKRKPGNDKGRAVRTWDPVGGPYTEEEFSALHKAVEAAYGQDELPLWAMLIHRLLFSTGARTAQLASLKIKDVNLTQFIGTIALPLAKTREQHSRASFKVFEVASQTSRYLRIWINELRSRGYGDEGALFPDLMVMKLGPVANVRDENDPFYGHCTTETLGRVFLVALQPHAPPTERLDFKPIPISPRRYRYTFGTRLGEEGASLAVIADQLTHTDMQNALVYTANSAKSLQQVNKALDLTLAPLALAFRGRLIEGAEQATSKDVSESRIIDFRISEQTIGSCTSCARSCGLSVPVACYTCFKFEPWLDAPHEEVLEYLLAQREEAAKQPRHAAINDDAIRAVQQVIAECEEARESRVVGGSQ